MRTSLQISLGSICILVAACGGQTITNEKQSSRDGTNRESSDSEADNDAGDDDDDRFILEVTPSTFSPEEEDYARCMEADSYGRIEEELRSFFFYEFPPEHMQAVCNKCADVVVACLDHHFCYGAQFDYRRPEVIYLGCGVMTECLDDLFWGETWRNACGTTPAFTCRNYLRDVHADTPPYDQVLTSELMTDICASCEKEIVACVESGQGAGGAPGDCFEVERCVDESLGLTLNMPWMSQW